MGLFGGGSKSSVNQTTNTTNINAQGVAAPTVIGEGNSLVVTDHQATARALDALAAGAARTNEAIERIASVSLDKSLGFGRDSLAFADDQSKRAADITLEAIDQIGAQNQRTIDTVAASSASTVREIANATRSEAAQLSEKVITYGTIAAAVVAIAWILK